MAWRLVVAICGVAVLGACSKKDPLYCDEDTPCTDPALPFCDLQGEYPASDGVARTCIPDPLPDGGTPPGEVELTVVKTGAGGGDIVSTPAGIECGTTCTASFPEGTEVTLTPEADSSSTFIGWQNDCSGLAACSLTLDGDSVATARFEPRGEHQFTKTFGTAGFEAVHFVGVDTSGNRVVAGTFEGTLDVGNTTPLTSAGQTDVFVARYAQSGEHLWSASYGTSESDSIWGAAMSGDHLVMVSGPVFAASGTTMIVRRIELGEGVVWSETYQSSSVIWKSSIAVDSSGSTAIAGSFSGTVDFGGGPLTGDNGTTGFVLMLTADGEHADSWSFDTPGASEVTALTFDLAGNLYLTGTLTAGLDFGGGVLATFGSSDIFLLKLGASGNHLWSKSFGGAGTERPHSIAVADDRVFLGGTYSDQANFGGGTLEGPTSDWTRPFIASYTAVSGSHRWSSGYGPHDGGYGFTMALETDARGNLYAGGSAAKLDLGSGALSSTNTDGWLASLDAATGAARWAKMMGGDGSDPLFDDRVLSIHVTAETVFAGGRFTGSGSFGEQMVQNAGEFDGFVVGFTP